MPTTILDNDSYPEALQRRYTEESRIDRKIEIIAMAKSAGFFEFNVEGWVKEFERFAAIVAEPWIETNKALAKEIIELKKQAEQEPVGYIDAVDLRELCNGNERQYSLFSEDKGRMVAIYAAPVRTKDLTDDEAQKLWNDTSSIVPMWAHHLHFARAVIAADREKNRG